MCSPSTHTKKLDIVAHACNSSTEEVEAEDQWGFLSSLPSVIGKPQVPARDTASETRWKVQ